MAQKKLKHFAKTRYKDIPTIEKQLEESIPDSGDFLYDYRIDALKEKYNTLSVDKLAMKLMLNFKDLPISMRTKYGLSKSNFVKLTEIQRCMIPHALAKRDILAASKTGSGKTLAYLIPIVENLYRQKWNVLDGLGAMVITPTRELAMQVFEVLKEISKYQEISIGLIIGGKSLQVEQDMIYKMNIIICTPGRMLQHLQETVGFEYSNLKLLVIDEADEILKMGFQNTLNQIIECLPKKRQTILVSATLEKKILGLGKLALDKPEKIYLSEVKMNNIQSSDMTVSLANIYEPPTSLKQYYMLLNYEEKIDCLFSFLKSHQRSKVLVFLTTCKQVRFVYSAFKKLKPGLPVMELHGRQGQSKRMAIYYTYSERKFACLFTTNLGSRGLDFPGIDWVVMVDCPGSLEGYMHKIGRTARFNHSGKSLLLLAKSESDMVDKIKEQKMEVHKLNPNPKRQLTIKKSLLALCSENNDLKYLAQRAVISYIKSLYYQPDKGIFNLKGFKPKRFSKSYGLIQTPLIKIGSEELGDNQTNTLERKVNESKNKKKVNKKLQKLKQKIEKRKKLKNRGEIDSDATIKNDELMTKNILHNTKRLKVKQSQPNMIKSNVTEDDNDNFLVIKQNKRNIEDIESNPWKLSKRQMFKIKKDGHFQGKNIKIIESDEENSNKNIRSVYDKNKEENKIQAQEVIDNNRDYLGVYSAKMNQTELEDKITQMKRIRKKKLKKKKIRQIIENQK